MKNKKKDIYGRTYTRFGYCLHIFLTVLGVAAFVIALGTVGSCEIERITLTECAKVVVPCIAVLGVCTIVHNKVFD